MPFGVLNFERSELRIFLFLVPAQAAPGKASDAHDDKNDADDSCWFHAANATAIAVRQSIAE